MSEKKMKKKVRARKVPVKDLTTTDSIESTAGIAYTSHITGKGAFRVRETCLVKLASLTRRPGAVKLYLIMRGICMPADNHGARRPGEILPHITYEELHDLCRDPRAYSTETPEDYESAKADRAKKREWVRDQITYLEGLDLVLREDIGSGDTPKLIVLRDDGSKKPLDDPDGRAGASYVTIHGSVISSKEYRGWGTPEVFAYLCSMVAGRYAANKHGGSPETATWFQPAKWFTVDEDRRPENHVLLPIGEKTILRGLRFLEAEGWLRSRKTNLDPYTPGRRFKKPRKVYVNHFDRLEAIGEVVDFEAARERRLG